MTDEVLLKIKNINESLNQSIPEEEVYRNVNWKIKTFEFENMFSYGEDNKVDFSKLNGVVGIFAPNASGKSSLLDALSFCLFDTCTRAFRAENVLNNKKKDFYCKLNFEVDGQDYFIEKTAKKQRKGNVKVDIDFYTIGDDGERVSMNGDQRRTTQVNIRKVIGTYDDFILTALSSQTNNSVFIEKTQKEKKTLLAQFMGLEIFDKLWSSANEEIREVAAILKNFKRNDWERELSDIKKEKEDFEKKHEKLLEAQGVIEETKNLEEDTVRDLTRKLKSIDKSISNIDELEDERDTLNESISFVKSQYEQANEKYEKRIDDKEKLNDKISGHENNDTNSKYEEAVDKMDYGAKLTSDLDRVKQNVSVKLEKVKKLGDLEYDEDCDYCMKNPFTLDAIETKKIIDKDKNKVKDLLLKIDVYNDWFHNNWKKIENAHIDYQETKLAFDKISSLINESKQSTQLLDEKEKNYINQLKFNEEKIQKYYEQEQDIVYNSNIEKEIQTTEDNLSDTNYKLDKVNKEINSVFAEIKVLDTKRKNILDNIDKVADLEKKYEAYEYYLDAVKRDGVPYELITKALPTIEGEVNNILSQLVDFQMVFEMDGKNINNYIVYDNDNIWPLELSSGMERFISSLAIRVGLINVSNLPRSNFLAIDEGWGTMDSDNLNSVYNLFQYLKSQFQFTLIVSHIDSMRDAVDTLLEVKKEKDFSNIIFD